MSDEENKLCISKVSYQNIAGVNIVVSVAPYTDEELECNDLSAYVQSGTFHLPQNCCSWNH